MQLLDALVWAKGQPATGAAEGPVAAPTDPTATGAAEGPAAAPADEKPVLPYAGLQKTYNKTTKQVKQEQARRAFAQLPTRTKTIGPWPGTWLHAEERAEKFCSSSSKANAEAPAAAMPAGWATGLEQPH